jgi:hypothetical protein
VNAVVCGSVDAAGFVAARRVPALETTQKRGQFATLNRNQVLTRSVPALIVRLVKVLDILIASSPGYLRSTNDGWNAGDSMIVLPVLDSTSRF